MELHGVSFPQEAIAEFCRRNGIRRLSLFGSILTNEFGPESDVDMLAEFEPGRAPGLIAFGGLILELSAIVGRRVDLRTPADLSEYFRPRILREARLLHAA